MSTVKMFKAIHEVEFYKKYAKRAAPELIIKENINNMIEHGIIPSEEQNVKYYITRGEDEIGKFVIFFNETLESENITLEDIIKHMTTFYKQEHKDRENYDKEHEHHGFTYNMRYPIVLHTGNIEIKTINHEECEEYYFWYKEEDVNLNAPFINGWEVKVYSEEIYNKIEEVIGWYIFPTDLNIDILLDGQKYEIIRMDINLDNTIRTSFWDASYNTRYLKYDLKFDETGEGKINGYWKLSNGIWQLIHMPDLNPNVKGSVYIDDNELLADESRGELVRSAENEIVKVINKIVNQHQREIEKHNKLKRYGEYVNNFKLIMKSSFGIPYVVIDDILSEMDDKEKRLVYISEIWSSIEHIHSYVSFDRGLPEYYKFDNNCCGLDEYQLRCAFGEYLQLWRFLDPKETFGMLYQEGELVGECKVGHLLEKKNIRIADSSINGDSLKNELYLEPVVVPSYDILQAVFPNRILYNLDDLTIRDEFKPELDYNKEVNNLNVGFNPDDEEFINLEQFEYDYSPIQKGYYIKRFSHADKQKYICLILDGRNNERVPYLFRSQDSYLKSNYKYVNYKVYMAFTKGVAIMMRYYKIDRPIITCLTSEGDESVEYYMNENILVLNSKLFITKKDGRKLVNTNLMIYKIAEAIAIMQYPKYSKEFADKFINILQELSKKLEYKNKTFYLSDELKQYF